MTHGGRVLHIGDDDAKKHLPYGALIAAISAYLGSVSSVPRAQHQLSGLGDPDARMLVMPAWSASAGYIGIKVVPSLPSNNRLGLPTLHPVQLLFDDRGIPLATATAHEITHRRTVAMAAVAASLLAPSSASRLLVLGTGAIARRLPLAFRELFELEYVGIWGRRDESAREVAALLRHQGLPAQAVSDHKAALGDAHIVSSATAATAPIITGRHLGADTHVQLIGSFTADMREADDETISGARVYVDNIDAIHETGDLIEPRDNGVPYSVAGTLPDLLAGPPPPPGVGRAVYKSVGNAAADLIALATIYRALISTSSTDHRSLLEPLS